jgi:hypothetical protein
VRNRVDARAGWGDDARRSAGGDAGAVGGAASAATEQADAHGGVGLGAAHELRLPLGITRKKINSSD